MIEVTTIASPVRQFVPAEGHRFPAGTTVYLENYWVDVLHYSPKSRNAWYRRLGDNQRPRYMPRRQFEREARRG